MTGLGLWSTAALALVVAALDWLAVARGWRRLEYAAKPGVMVLLLAGLWAQGPWPVPVGLFALGLLGSLVGDICLMLPADLFLPGLVAFLLAHLAYLASFSAGGLPPVAPAVVAAVPLAAVAAWLAGRVLRGLAARGRSRLRVPVVAYTVVLALMVHSATLTLARPGWDPVAAGLVAAGAILFLLSDAMLAWDRFVGPVRHGRLGVIMAYHVAQILMTMGVGWEFL